MKADACCLSRFDERGPEAGSGLEVNTKGWRMIRRCRELTTLWVARLDEGTELKVTDPKEQQRDVEEEEAKGEERRDGVDWG